MVWTHRWDCVGEMAVSSPVSWSLHPGNKRNQGIRGIRECLWIRGLLVLCFRSGLDGETWKEGMGEHEHPSAILLMAKSQYNSSEEFVTPHPHWDGEKPPLILPFCPALIRPCQWGYLGPNNPFDPRPFIPDCPLAPALSLKQPAWKTASSL